MTLSPARLVLGPLLRYVGDHEATVWVETDRACWVEVLGCSSATFAWRAITTSVIVLSGDVHHAYLAEASFPGRAPIESAVVQAVCSPIRNPLDRNERRARPAARDCTKRSRAPSPERRTICF